ncbi:MAG: histidine kinase dimerization/phospho-acceptor domain-containing protein, partial [Thermosynechococcaceae cyanobacterium]
HLDSYLVIPHQLAQINVNALETGFLNNRDFYNAGHFFWKYLQVYQNISFLGFYLNNGEGVAAQRWPPGSGVNIVQHSLRDGKDYNYATDSQGNRTKLLDSTTYFAPQEQWYIDAVKANKPFWSRINTAEEFPGYIAVSALYPLHDKNKKIIGIFGVDLLLNDISEFLQKLPITQNGMVFILEHNGLLIGNSGASTTYKVINGKSQRLSALSSPNPYLKDTAQFLKNRFGDLINLKNEQYLEFYRDNKKQFVQVRPWRDRYGLDWLVIVTIPETDFTAQINANTQTTILLCIAALLTATLLGMMTARWITQPILRLSQASQAIASGDLDQNVQIKGIRELQRLSYAFNRMAEQLRDWVNLLESRVVERTAQLDEAKQSAENAREVAIAANRSKSQFLANMSHELRTPLNAILGFAQVMNRDSSLRNDQQEDLRVIIRSGEHLLALINDVLDMSKIESGRINLVKSNFNLYHLLASVQEMLGLRAQVKGLQLVVNYTEALPQYIHTDEKKLRQVLLNLLGNAVKFTESGFVSLHVDRDNDTERSPDANFYLRFVVEDSGPG